MSNLRIEFLSPAMKELDRIAEMHMVLVGVKSAEKITDEILNSIENLKLNPLLGVAIEEDSFLFSQGYRKLICGKYLCFYRVIEKTIFIYHIVDGRTDYPQLIEKP